MKMKNSEHSRTINAGWHKKNRMPEYLEKFKGKKPVKEIKAMWHEIHSRECNCRA